MHVVTEWQGPGYYASQSWYNGTQYWQHWKWIASLTTKGHIDAMRIARDWGSYPWKAQHLSDLITSAEVIDKTQKEQNDDQDNLS